MPRPYPILLLAAAAVLFSSPPSWSADPPSAPEGPAREAAAFDPGAPPKTRIRLTEDLSVGARIELEYQVEKNFDLNKAEPDDLSFFDPLLSVALSYAPSPKVGFFANVEATPTYVHDEENKRNDEMRIFLKQAYLSLNDLVAGLTVKAGRQRLRDKREWIYDEELDGVRVFYTVSRFALDLSASEKNDTDFLHGGDEEDITNLVAYGMYSPSKDHEVGAYVFFRDDRSFANESPLFFGLHAAGEAVKHLEYWIEAAHVRGDSGRAKIRGFGFDAGATYEIDAPLRPSLTLGYAFGGGDGDLTDGKDENFRQTGLQENEAKFNGVKRFKYYGELLDPELSNLRVLTAGIGIRPTRESSVDLVVHHLEQDKATRVLRNFELDEDPNGLDRELGTEVDLVAAYRGKNRVDLSVSLGYFRPGDAFGSNADKALFSEVKARYEF